MQGHSSKPLTFYRLPFDTNSSVAEGLADMLVQKSVFGAGILNVDDVAQSTCSLIAYLGKKKASRKDKSSVTAASTILASAAKDKDKDKKDKPAAEKPRGEKEKSRGEKDTPKAAVENDELLAREQGESADQKAVSLIKINFCVANSHMVSPFCRLPPPCSAFSTRWRPVRRRAARSAA